jgi:glucose/mannose-6-phosphate isomerase
VIDLDDVAALRGTDPSDMLGAIAELPRHCRDAYDDARALTLPSADGVTAVTFLGMGGSAVAGDVVRSVFRERLDVPVDVNRSPALPAYCGPHTLVVASSYSGNTSETLTAFREAVVRGCRIVAITSGGTLAEEAGVAGIPVVPVPGGYQPRAALGHLGFASLGALEAMGLLPTLADDVAETVAELTRLVGLLGPASPLAGNPAKQLAGLIGERIPVIWGAEGIGAVAAMRWKCQMNENGKVPAFAASMSELDHNEVVGWTRPYGERCTLVALRHDGEHPELAARFALSYDIARDAGVAIEEVHGTGTSSLTRLMALVVAGDFASAYVGIRRGVDPTPVVVIERLKASLAGS